MSLQTAAQAIITDVDDTQNDDGLQTVRISRKLIDTLRAELALIDGPGDFENAWKHFTDMGYSYGEDALEHVRFGYEIAHGRTPR